MILPRSLYSAPPRAKNSKDDNPTLLVSWWCTGFALAIILVRISGRYIRTEKLFREDKIMALSMIPLLGRMALIHIVMIWGTNNTTLEGLTALEIRHREIGSRLVLVARIMYAAFLWIAKFTVSEFLKRLTSQVWRRKYELGLQFIRWFLIVTFAAVVIATLAECQPFHKYWQVVPDPGAKCRQGYSQLIVMGASDSVTDLLIVGFPIPIVLKSNMPVKRKVSLVLLFSLSLILIGITIYRVIGVVDRHSDQQFRSLLASLEILAAAAVSNALVLGSFVRDRGVKKQRFRFGSIGGSSSLDRQGTGIRPRTITIQTWGSDADLAGELGMRIAPDLEHRQNNGPRPAPLALPPAALAKNLTPNMTRTEWKFPARESAETDETDMKGALDPGPDSEKPPPSPSEIEIITPRRMSFFDVGGLLGDDALPQRRRQTEPSIPEMAPSPTSPEIRYTNSRDPPTLNGIRRGSSALLSDIGGLLSPQSQQSSVTRNFSRPTSPTSNLPQNIPTIHQPASPSKPTDTTSHQRLHPRQTNPHHSLSNSSSTFRDVGGLLG